MGDTYNKVNLGPALEALWEPTLYEPIIGDNFGRPGIDPALIKLRNLTRPS
ncbi:MAG: hypothetical protein ABI947_02520 [Chloroflexota bacterium]